MSIRGQTSRLLPHPWLSAVLWALWLLLVRSASLGHLALGALLAFTIPFLTRPFWEVPPDVRRYGPAFRLVPLFLWDVLVANIAVAALIVNPRRTPRPAWVVIPLDIRDPYAITTLANMISLTPGTVSSKLTPDRLQLLVHVVDTDDPEGEVNRIKQRYERPLQEIFE